MRLIPALTLSLLIGTAPLVRAAADNPEMGSYFPLKVGTTWVYKTGTKEVVIKVARLEKVGNVLCGLLETNNPDTQKPLTEAVGVTKDGIFRFMGQNMKIEPPLMLLPLKPKKGDTFNVDSVASDKKIKGTFTIGEEPVTVPAGKYKAFTTKCDALTVGDMTWSITYWFAPEVGMVKQEVKVKDFTLTLELSKFTAGKQDGAGVKEKKEPDGAGVKEKKDK